jgi:hypothetical protein
MLSSGAVADRICRQEQDFVFHSGDQHTLLAGKNLMKKKEKITQ